MSDLDTTKLYGRLNDLVLGSFIVDLAQVDTPYQVQREVLSSQVENLKEQFQQRGVLRYDIMHVMFGIAERFPTNLTYTYGMEWPKDIRITLLSGHHRKAAFESYEPDSANHKWSMVIYSPSMYHYSAMFSPINLLQFRTHR